MSEIGIIAIGGYNEVGRNMTAVKIDDDIVIMDMGIMLDRVQIHEDVETEKMHSLGLIEIGAIPDDTLMNQVDGTVRAIVCSHGHLDHIGAVSKLAHRYDAPIIGTPFTIELISQQIKKEQKFKVKNPLQVLKPGETSSITADIDLEFVGVQHSIIDAAFAVLHTPHGLVIYANDFKLDRTPVLGNPIDTKRLRELGEEGVKAMIVESVRVENNGKTPSEQVARDMLRDILLGTEETNTGVLITTFSSHIARIKSIIDGAREIGREPVLLGRSMEGYGKTAIEMGYLDAPKDLRICGRRQSIDRMLEEIMREGRDKYLPIITGHQGEPGAMLTRIADKQTPYKIEEGDKIIFSAGVIPTPLSAANRYAVETKLNMAGARIYKDVHVSGHASKEDHWELLRLVSPEHVVPSHGSLKMRSVYAELAEEAGYVLGESVHLIRNGQQLCI